MANNYDELEKLARAATPGPWEATRQTDDECSFIGYFIEAQGEAQHLTAAGGRYPSNLPPSDRSSSLYSAGATFLRFTTARLIAASSMVGFQAG